MLLAGRQTRIPGPVSLLPVDDGWKVVREAWAYASASTITVPAGAATRYSVGDKIRFKQGAGYKYYYIVVVADTLLTIAINTDYTVANAAITDIYHSKAQTPLDFPDWFTFAPSYSASGSMTFLSTSTDYAKYKIDGRTCFVLIRGSGTTGGTASNTLQFAAPVGAIDANQPGQAGFVLDGGNAIAAYVLASSTSLFGIRRYDGANFGLGAGRILSCGVYYQF